MRRLALLAASIPFALGCAQQSTRRPADVPTDQPLQVRLQNPTGGGLTYSLSEPAYVAIFAISRTGGVGLVHPTLESQVHLASRAGANQLTIDGRARASIYNVDRSVVQSGVLAPANAYYIIASKHPLLAVGEMIRSPRVLGTFLDQFRATSLSSAGDEIGAALAEGLPDGDWAGDTYFGSGLPFQSIAARRNAFLVHCPPIGTNSVPMTSTGQCERVGGKQR